MTDVRDIDTFLASLRNFDWLKGVVPGASDMDGVCHASAPDGSDWFLVFEGKRTGERLSLGQRRMLDGMRRQPNFTVVVVYGPDSDGEYFLTGAWTGRVTLDELKARVGAWFNEKKGLASGNVA